MSVLLEAPFRSLLSQPDIRIVFVGFLSNIALAGVKFTAASMYHSTALAADGWHSLADVISDSIALTALMLKRNRTGFLARCLGIQRYFGSGRGELNKLDPFASLIVSAIIVRAGIGFAWESLQKIITFLPTAYAHGGHLHISSEAVGAAGDVAMSPEAAGVAFSIALVVILSKEWLSRATNRIAISHNSELLHSTATHHRSDSWTTAALGLGCAAAGVPVAEPLAGLAVSMMIIWQAIKPGARSILRLLDASSPLSAHSRHPEPDLHDEPPVTSHHSSSHGDLHGHDHFDLSQQLLDIGFRIVDRRKMLDGSGLLRVDVIKEGEVSSPDVALLSDWIKQSKRRKVLVRVTGSDGFLIDIRAK
ncbi:cation efflux protein [Atractiella rhizophila]|nr:cation efflux protein [Atractiella rhizophila]